MNLTQIINKDNKPVPVKVIGGGSGGGGITGKDIETGEQINEASFEVDGEGFPVLRIIDAAPFAYDPASKALRVIVLSSTAAINVAVSESITLASQESRAFEFAPPVGKIWRLKRLYFSFPALTAPTSGEHQINIQYNGSAAPNSVMLAKTAYNKSLDFNYGKLSETVDTQTPPDNQLNALKDLLITSDYKLFINYQNISPVAVTTSIKINILFEEEGSL